VTRKEIAVGKETLIVETGQIARQADGAVTVRYGDTVVLVTAVAAKSPREGIDFLPLTVDYRENTYAAGKIPGGFFRREGRPNEKEVLTSRMIDRPLRPLFPEGWACETQIIGLVLSSDQRNDSDVLAITGASFALGLSSIPFPIPIAAVRVALSRDGEYLINPTFEELETSRLDLVVAGSADAIVMVEAGANEVSENELLDAMYRGHEEIRRIVEAQKAMIAEAGKPKRQVEPPPELAEVRTRVTGAWKERLAEAMRIKGKLVNYAQVDRLKDEMLASFADDAPPAERAFAKRVWGDLQEQVLREEILERGRRLDGRRFDEIRARTAPRCSRAARPRPWPRSRSGRRPTPSAWTGSKARRCAASCCITTSRPSRSARSSSCAAPGAGRSVTVRWASARCCR
jgi:polyribonucleotide nucleotidyltransferase